MEASFVEESGASLADRIGDRAAAEAVDGLLVLAADDDLDPDTFDPVLTDLPVPVFGGMFPEILYEGERFTSGAVVVELAVEPDVSIVSELSDPETAIRPQLHTSVRTPGETTVFAFVDGFAERIQALIERLFESYGLECTFLGGGAGSLSMEQGPCIFTNEGLLTDAAVLATVAVPSSVGVTHGWQEVDGPFRVNDAEASTLTMLGDEPAFDVYRRVVEADAGTELTEENFFEVAKSYPFGLSRLHGEKIVRDPFAVESDGSLSCFGDIPEGEYLHILKGESSALVDAANEAAASAIDGNGSVVSFDCISRVLFLEDEFARELAEIGGPTEPAVGALTIGEIANGAGGQLQFYNKTVVVAELDGL